MPKQQTTSRFETILQRPTNSGLDRSWTFLRLPKEVSDTLPRRGRTSVKGTLNGHVFQATLEPDGQLSHWLMIRKELRDLAGAAVGETVTVELSPMDPEPEPDMPKDLAEALGDTPDALSVWHTTTTIARVDWIHWIVSAKQLATRKKRIHDACDMLAKGKKRVCCFDPSGFYSKAFRAPEPEAKKRNKAN